MKNGLGKNDKYYFEVRRGGGGGGVVVANATRIGRTADVACIASA